jgi:PAS domain S-box-containing protein
MKPQQQKQQIGAQQKYNILLVDDRAENLLALEAVLSDMGQNLLKARSGDEALRHLLRQNDFAVVVLDAHMPGMDGFETARQIRSRTAFQALPIIFVTAVHQSNQYALKAYSLGAVDYVYKPFDPEALKAKVRVFVELAQKSREVKIQAELLRLNNQDLECRVRERTADLERANQELRVLFRQSPHPKWVCDLTSLSFLAVNQAATRTYGYTEDEFLRMTLTDLRPPEAVPGLMERVDQLRRGQPVEAVFRHRKKDGRLIWAETAAHPIQFEGRPAALVVATDVTRRKQAEEALQTSERQYRQIVETAREGIWLVDQQWRTTYVNPALCQMLGYGAEELLGQSPFKFLFEEDYPWANTQMERRQQGIAEHSEVRLRRKDGSFLWTLSQASPVVDGQGNFAGALAMVNDITDRKRAEVALTRHAEELARSNAELEQFAYVASHDLQEPLRMVTLYTQLLAKRYECQLDAQAREFISYAVKGAGQMQRLIHDLLDYSRVNSRVRQFELINSAEALRSACAHLQTPIDESRAILTYEGMPTVRADPGQLTQLFQNLVSNALKFSGPNPPRIHVTARLDGNQWLFSVQDNGIGLDPQFAERIFVIFQRLHSKEQYAGTGMGLAICKKIVEQHGGRIWVESRPGEWATFYFTLPSLQTESRGSS